MSTSSEYTNPYNKKISVPLYASRDVDAICELIGTLTGPPYDTTLSNMTGLSRKNAATYFCDHFGERQYGLERSDWCQVDFRPGEDGLIPTCEALSYAAWATLRRLQVFCNGWNQLGPKAWTERLEEKKNAEQKSKIRSTHVTERLKAFTDSTVVQRIYYGSVDLTSGKPQASGNTAERGVGGQTVLSRWTGRPPQYCKAVYDFPGGAEGQMPFTKGTRLEYLGDHEEWSFVQKTESGETGWAPSSYLQSDQGPE